MRLTSLGIHSTKISDDGFESLSAVTSLRSLNCSNTDITDTGIQHISKLVYLRHLVLDIFEGNVSCEGLMMALTSLKLLNTLHCRCSKGDNAVFLNFCRDRKLVLDGLDPTEY